jgi:hypothetical protein
LAEETAFLTVASSEMACGDRLGNGLSCGVADFREAGETDPVTRDLSTSAFARILLDPQALRRTGAASTRARAILVFEEKRRPDTATGSTEIFGSRAIFAGIQGFNILGGVTARHMRTDPAEAI